mgnify:CR=1 FL=1
MGKLTEVEKKKRAAARRAAAKAGGRGVTGIKSRTTKRAKTRAAKAKTSGGR